MTTEKRPWKRRPCWVEISTGAFELNYRTLIASISADQAGQDQAGQDQVGQNAAGQDLELLAIVKAGAYGHGLELCAPAAVRAGAHWLGVTSVEEGVAAREVLAAAGLSDVSILVISGPFAGQGVAAIGAGLTCVVWEEWQLAELESAALTAELDAGTVDVHLELNTGMSRQGVDAEGLGATLDRFSDGLQAGSVLRLDGLMTHLYAADESDGVTTLEQLARLEQMVGLVHQRGLRPSWLHVGNSAAVMAGDALLELRAICIRWGLQAMSRPGLALYGLAPEFEPSEPEAVGLLREKLRPVMEWKTQVVSLRAIDAGQVVGYNGTFVATEPMRLALLAVGYADGLKRALSNCGEVLVGGCMAPIVGRISMDQTVVDVTDISDVKAGDEVVLIGRQGEEAITVGHHARWAGTVPWEIFTSIAARVERRAV